MTAQADNLLWPLNVFYERDRILPEVTPLTEQQVPSPYRELLVHEDDMTPTLEHHYEDTIHIERLNHLAEDAVSSREVILRLDGNDRAVVYGASRVFLDQLHEHARELLAEGRLPVGTILRICEIAHRSQPTGFFRVKPMPLFEEVFKQACNDSLFGRRNTLLSAAGDPIVEVTEILPPDVGPES
jgi:chorismate-pyruvate lyase